MHAPPTAPGPVPPGERVLALDVLRGFALFGVFVVNASLSSMPFLEAVEPPADGGTAETLAWAFVVGGCVTKFVSLFSLLFGIGLALQLGNVAARGGDVGVLRRRLGWLALFGLLHGCLLFEGDILLPYAAIGLALLRLRKRSTRTLLVVAGILYAIGLALELAALGPQDDLAWALASAAARRGDSVAAMVAHRTTEYALWLLASSLSLFHWQVASLFLVGMVAVRCGWLGPENRARHRTVAIGGLLGGSLLVGGSALLEDAPAALTLAFEVGSLVLAAGYAGTVFWAVQRRLAIGLQRALAATGRMALTNYVAQSVLMHVVFHEALGLGLWNELSRVRVLAIVVVLFAAQVAFSVLWTRCFGRGPLEGLWRRLTYGPGVLRRRSAPG